MYEYRCDERLKGKAEGSTRLTYTLGCAGDWTIKYDVVYKECTRHCSAILFLMKRESES